MTTHPETTSYEYRYELWATSDTGRPMPIEHDDGPTDDPARCLALTIELAHGKATLSRHPVHWRTWQREYGTNPGDPAAWTMTEGTAHPAEPLPVPEPVPGACPGCPWADFLRDTSRTDCPGRGGLACKEPRV